MSRDQSEEELRNIVAKTISSVDMDGDGKVSFLEFQQVRWVFAPTLTVRAVAGSAVPMNHPGTSTTSTSRTRTLEVLSYEY